MDYAERIVSLRWSDLPRAVQRQARRCLKDIVGTAAGSLALPTSQRTARLVAAQFGQSARVGAHLLFRGVRTSLAGASFGNALSVDSLDCHDGFRLTKGHAGATVVPVALATCEVRPEPAAGVELLTAIAIGYEIACRAGIALHAAHAPYYPASGSWAGVGAAAAASRLLGLSASAIDPVLGAAEYYGPMSPMLRCTVHPSIVKDGAGAGAWAAAMAVAMHQQGMHGLPSMFAEEPRGREEIASFAADWMILRQYFKLYPTCRWSHPPVEAALGLQRVHGFSATEIEGIGIESFAEAGTIMTFPPVDSDSAQYCLPWAVAAALTDGALGIEQILPTRLSDPSILDLGQRVTFRAAADIQERFPKECLARVTVRLRDGRSFSRPAVGARGDYTNPATDGELDLKFRQLTAPTLGERLSRRLEEVLDAIEERPAADLLALLKEDAAGK